MNKKNQKKVYLLALVPFLLLIAIFELAPLITIIGRSFMPEGGGIGFTFDHYASIFTKKLYQQALINSLWISAASSIIGLLISLIAAKAVNDAGPKVKNAFTGILNMCSNFAGIPLAFAYIILLGNTGILVNIGKELGIDALAEFPLYSSTGLILIYIYFQIPLAVMLMLPAFEGVRKEWGEAVSLLGGNSLQFWMRVGLPSMLPSILGSLGVLFSNSIAAYASAYALLQNNFSLLPIRISEQFVGDVVQRKEFGSALAVMLMLFMVLAMYMNSLILKRRQGGQIR